MSPVMFEQAIRDHFGLGVKWFRYPAFCIEGGDWELAFVFSRKAGRSFVALHDSDVEPAEFDSQSAIELVTVVVGLALQVVGDRYVQPFSPAWPWEGE